MYSRQRTRCWSVLPLLAFVRRRSKSFSFRPKEWSVATRIENRMHVADNRQMIFVFGVNSRQYLFIGSSNQILREMASWEYEKWHHRSTRETALYKCADSSTLLLHFFEKWRVRYIRLHQASSTNSSPLYVDHHHTEQAAQHQ